MEPDITFTARPSGPFGVGGALDWDEEENVEDWLQNLMANERDPMLREQLMAIQGMAEVRLVGGAAGMAAERFAGR